MLWFRITVVFYFLATFFFLMDIPILGFDFFSFLLFPLFPFRPKCKNTSTFNYSPPWNLPSLLSPNAYFLSHPSSPCSCMRFPSFPSLSPILPWRFSFLSFLLPVSRWVSLPAFLFLHPLPCSLASSLAPRFLFLPVSLSSPKVSNSHSILWEDQLEIACEGDKPEKKDLQWEIKKNKPQGKMKKKSV